MNGAWPADDTAYMKLIYKLPTPKYPNGFHLLGSRIHPVGDFDTDTARLPDEPLRIYKTAHGYRVFFTGRYNPDLDSMCDELLEMGGDPQYSKFVKMRGYYGCRVDPKTQSNSDGIAVTRFLSETAPALPEWSEFIQTHDRMTNAFDLSAILL